jgi:hypothetical protein
MQYQSHRAPSGTAFPHVRSVVADSLVSLSDADLADALGESGIDAAAAEDFMSGLRQFGTAFQQRLPSIIQGAGTGLAVGSAAGPYGALAGALGGAVLGGLTAPSPQPPAPSPATPRPGMPAPAAPSLHVPPGVLAPVSGPPSTAGGGASAGFAALLANPALQQALLQMAMGSSGRSSVTLPTGQAVPNEAFAELIREAADQVLAERAGIEGAESETPEYLQEADHRNRRVREDPALRAAVLLRLLEPPPQPYVPVPAVTAPVAVNPYGPIGVPAPAPTQLATVAAGEPLPAFTTYAPPELGATGPTVYGIDAAYAEPGDAWAEWEFDAAIDDALGTGG